MVKNDICVGGARKQMLFFSENVSQKNGPMAAMPWIGLGNISNFPHCSCQSEWLKW